MADVGHLADEEYGEVPVVVVQDRLEVHDVLLHDGVHHDDVLVELGVVGQHDGGPGVAPERPEPNVRETLFWCDRFANFCARA